MMAYKYTMVMSPTYKYCNTQVNVVLEKKVLKWMYIYFEKSQRYL